MSDRPISDTVAPAADAALGFTVAARNVRGQLVRLDTPLNAILAAHDYPAPLARLLAEALVLTALLGATLRPEAAHDSAQLTLQVQSTGGVVDLLVCDWQAGAIRGYLRHDAMRPPVAGMDLAALFGEGHLAITYSSPLLAERFQGIVPLAGSTLAHAVEGYFIHSEQLPTLVRIGVGGDAASGWRGGGLLIQHLARTEIGGPRLDVAAPHPDWEHIATLAATITDAELTDPLLSPEELLWRLFHEETVRLLAAPLPTRGCRCSAQHIQSVLDRFSIKDRNEMRGEDGTIRVDCAFCARTFVIEA